MEVSMSSQFYVFLLSILLGLVLSIIYAFVSGIKSFFGIYGETTTFTLKICKMLKYELKPKKKKIEMFIFDILYFVIVTPIILVFLHNFNNGILRWYITVGVIIGFWVCRNTVSRVIQLFLEPIMTACRILFLRLLIRIFKLFKFKKYMPRKNKKRKLMHNKIIFGKN